MVSIKLSSLDQQCFFFIFMLLFLYCSDSIYKWTKVKRGSVLSHLMIQVCVQHERFFVLHLNLAISYINVATHTQVFINYGLSFSSCQQKQHCYHTALPRSFIFNAQYSCHVTLIYNSNWLFFLGFVRYMLTVLGNCIVSCQTFMLALH